MIFRTDLALEERESAQGEIDGVEQEQEQDGKCVVTRIGVRTDEASRRLRKPCGEYITVEMPAISDHIDGQNVYMTRTAQELRRLIPGKGLVLVAGLGNRAITPDALGPQAAGMVLATRHIRGELARVAGLEGLRPVAVAAPGVLGNTGFEAAELLQGLVRQLEPEAVVAVDALAARSLARLGRTVQLSDTGISPGSGIGNARKELTEKTLGIPVIGVGVPTVVDAATLAADLLGGQGLEEIEQKISPDGASMVVTPREIDLLVSRAAKLVAMAVNLALNPQLSVEEISALVL